MKGACRNLGAVVLAAGHATRFGGGKMNAPFHGLPLLHHAIALARRAPVSHVVVVTRPESGIEVGNRDAEPPIDHLVLASEALSETLRAGLNALSGMDGAFVFLGDMPLVPPGMALRLADALGDHYAALPVAGDLPGHPVLLSARAMTDACLLKGDAGAGRLLRGRSDVIRLPCIDPGIILDIDSREDLARAQAQR